jgi:hypothetical protein
MSKVPAYHTNSLEYPPEHRNVYHDHDDCFEGKKIQQKHRENGTGGKDLCKECKKLG